MQQPIRYVPVCRVKRRNLLWKAARKGKEMKVIGASFPWQRRENGQEALSPAELPFSGMECYPEFGRQRPGRGLFSTGLERLFPWRVFAAGTLL